MEIRSHLINTRLVSKAYFHKVRIAPETQKCAVWVTTRAVLSKLFPIYEIASSDNIRPRSVLTDNTPMVRFSATLGEEPEIELSLS